VVAKGVSPPEPGIVAPYLPLQYKSAATWPRFCILAPALFPSLGKKKDVGWHGFTNSSLSCLTHLISADQSYQRHQR
jgi:hypothetical protein